MTPWPCARGGAPCRQVRALAARKLEELEARIGGLRQLRNNLRLVLADWDERLAGAKNGERAWLLETFVHGGPTGRGKRPGIADVGGRK